MPRQARSAPPSRGTVVLPPDDGSQLSPPMASSSEGGSMEARYFSHFETTHQMKEDYWNILYQAAIYVRKEQLRSGIDDRLMQESISLHLQSNTILPKPTDSTGAQLIQNGYFLLAYAISLSRSRSSLFLLNYLLSAFLSEYSPAQNQDVVRYYIFERPYELRLADLENTEASKQSISVSDTPYFTPILMDQPPRLPSQGGSQGSETVFLVDLY